MYYFIVYHDHDKPSEILWSKDLKWNEPIGFSSKTCGYETLEELRVGAKLHDEPCKICKNIFSLNTYGAEKLASECICFYCDFWKSKIGLAKAIVVDGRHYTDGGKSSDPARWKGFGGHKWKIRMFSGEIIETDNLWHQGTIPPWFTKDIPNNAEFIL